MLGYENWKPDDLMPIKIYGTTPQTKMKKEGQTRKIKNFVPCMVWVMPRMFL